jgi:undecaprenyl-diphosphatase
MATDLISALIIAVVQGIAEWMPISSSGHLVIAERLLNYSGGLQFDVALHFGTLMAVFVYFGKDIIDIAEDILKGKWASDNAKLGFLILIASIPAALFGFVFKKYFEVAFSSLGVVALGFGITGIVLLIASLDFSFAKGENNWKKALFIGLGQALALFPGISRSGMTISCGLLGGLKEKNALKFSFLMSIPVVIGANIIEIGNETLPRELIWATLAAFAVGLASIYFLMKIVLASRKNLRYFAAYCLILALILAGYLIIF